MILPQTRSLTLECLSGQGDSMNLSHTQNLSNCKLCFYGQKQGAVGESHRGLQETCTALQELTVSGEQACGYCREVWQQSAWCRAGEYLNDINWPWHLKKNEIKQKQTHRHREQIAKEWGRVREGWIGNLGSVEGNYYNRMDKQQGPTI